MADKKRAVLDAYAACEQAMKRCQALADTDGSEQELGNRATGHMAPLMDMMRAHMGSAGYLDGATMAARTTAARDKVLATLEAELGESDPEKLHGKLLARLLSAAPAPTEGVLLSAEDAALATKMLLDGHRAKYPTTRRASLEALPLPGVMTFLSAAGDIVPMEQAAREAAPAPPTSAATEKAMKDAPKPAGVPGGKPTTLAACTAQQRIQVDAQLAASRMFLGAGFNEQVELQHALAALSDTDEAPRGNEIRHLPYGVDPSTGRLTTLTETV